MGPKSGPKLAQSSPTLHRSQSRLGSIAWWPPSASIASALCCGAWGSLPARLGALFVQTWAAEVPAEEGEQKTLWRGKNKPRTLTLLDISPSSQLVHAHTTRSERRNSTQVDSQLEVAPLRRSRRVGVWVKNGPRQFGSSSRKSSNHASPPPTWRLQF